MFDTGNLLQDPVGGRAVILLELSSIKGAVEEALFEAIQSRDTAALASLSHKSVRRVRLIPAGTATGHGMLFALVPDSAVLDMGRGEVAVEILLAPTTLGGNIDGCEALLPAQLLAQ